MIDFWRPMAYALEKQDRDILLNLCEYGDSDPWTWAPQLEIQSWRLLDNADVFQINQDELGHVAEVVYENEQTVVMVKNLVGGGRALALFNRNAEQACEIEIHTEWLGDASRKQVLDPKKMSQGSGVRCQC